MISSVNVVDNRNGLRFIPEHLYSLPQVIFRHSGTLSLEAIRLNRKYIYYTRIIGILTIRIIINAVLVNL